MSRSTGFALMLLALGLAWSGPPVAAAERRTEAGLTEAKELLSKRLPKAAIPILVRVIEQRRDDREQSVEALISLVECFQLLKGDVDAERDYALLGAKYLSRPPALDGKSLPTVEEATDDLLWKSWIPGQESRVEIKLQQIDWRESGDGRGGRRKVLHASYRVTGAGPLLDGSRMADGDPAKADVMIARTEAGEYRGKVSATAHNGGIIGVVFPDLPAPLATLPELSGVIHLCQPLRIKAVDVPFKRNAGWGNEPGTGMITEMATNAKGVTVTCLLSGGRLPTPGSTMERYVLLTPNGRPIRLASVAFSGSEGNGEMELAFGQVQQREVDRLRVSVPIGLSWKAFPVRFTDLKLK